MNLYGHDMDETISPLAAGMGWTIATGSRPAVISSAAPLWKPNAPPARP